MDLQEIISRLRQGDQRALARAVSLVEDGAPEAAALVAACRVAADAVVRVGITGPAGAGKSTLVDQMTRRLRDAGRRVAVLAVDPTSPFTGGAILGDRIRMKGFEGDAGVFFRSMATRGAMGGVARAAEDVCMVLGAAGFAEILIETVGVGQDEVEIVRVADVTVVVLAPGMGDDVQSIKAGLMEAADIYVVNQADREGAERMEAEIRGMQGLVEDKGWVAPVVRTVATQGVGVAELMEAVERCRTSGRKKRMPVQAVLGGLAMDHLGVAVKSIADAKKFYEALGLRVSLEETVAQEQVKVSMLPLGESRVELLEATSKDSVIGRFVAKRGEGLHHVAVRVPDVDAVFARMRAEDVRLVNDAVQVGAGGHRYFFVHPASAGGVLVEIVGA